LINFILTGDVMTWCRVVAFDQTPPETAQYLLSIAAKCIADSRTETSCQIIGSGAGGGRSALLVVGRETALKMLAEMLQGTFARWGEPAPSIDTTEAVAPGLRSPAAQPQTLDWRQNKLASLLHEQWRQDYLAKNPGQSRMKKTNDAGWSASHGGRTEVDLAGTPFDELPADWQTENQAAARHVLADVDEAARNGGVLTEQFVEDAAARAHDQWLHRNQATARADQKGAFTTLSAAEQQKDRVQVYLAKFVHDVWPPT
jgi:hypothetical protein